MVILDILQSIFPAVWNLFTGVNVPGTDISFGTFFVAVLIIKFSILLIQHGLGFGGGSGYRSGSTNNPKISKERKGDTH